MPNCLRLREDLLKAIYDTATDTLTLELGSGVVVESDEDKPGVIIDYDAAGNVVGIEILDASKRIADARTMQFQVAG